MVDDDLSAEQEKELEGEGQGLGSEEQEPGSAGQQLDSEGQRPGSEDQEIGSAGQVLEGEGSEPDGEGGELDEQEQPAEELSDEEKAMAKLKEAVIVEKEEIGPLRLKLTITVPRETLDERRDEQFDELKRDAMVPGFRKGHAPLVLVEKRFGSDVGEQLKTTLIGSGYLAATEKEDIKTLGDPLFWVKLKEERVGEDKRPRMVETEKLLPLDQALDHIKLPKEESLTFSCEIEIKPEFELPEIEKIPVKRPAVEIDDDDVETELKRMRMGRGTFEPVEEGEIEADDMLYVEMKMYVEDELIATEENYDMAARDMRAEGVPLVGFGEAVVGKKIGEEVTIEAAVPDDHENIDIRGKTAKFDIAIREVKRLQVPPIDEEFLSATGFDTEEELRSTLRSAMESRLGDVIQRALREQIGEYLIENTELQIPEGLSQRQVDRSIERRMIEMYQANVPEAEIAKAVDEMRSKAYDQAVLDLKLFFILEKIAEERSIEVAEEEINNAIAEIARQSNKRFDRVRDELSKGKGLMNLFLQLRDRKVLEALLEDAEITETEGPKKKAAEKKAKKKSTKEEATKEPDEASS